MGYDADAILAFGVDLGERYETEVPWWNEDDEEDADEELERGFEAWLTELAGASTREIWKTFEAVEAAHPEWRTEHVTWTVKEEAWEEAVPGVHDQLEEKRRRLTLFEAACPIDVVSYVSSDSPHELVVVRGTEVKATFGSAKTVTALDVDPVAVEAAREWCAGYDIPFEDPRWLLVSELSY